MQDLRYPIGEFNPQTPVLMAQTRGHIAEIAGLPAKLTELVGQWNNERLDTPYRPGGWTVRQLVHHLADSHLNGYARTKLALTETNPTIKPYDEAEWANLADSRLDVAPSLVILPHLHQRWVALLASLTESDWQRTYFHPGSQKTVTVAGQAAQYAWHGEHHYQHVYWLAGRNGWV